MNNARKEHLLPVAGTGPKPGDFPLFSRESRAATRLLAAWKAEGDGINIHEEVVGFGPDPNCSCRACRQKWSKATSDERAAYRLSLQKYLDQASALIKSCCVERLKEGSANEPEGRGVKCQAETEILPNNRNPQDRLPERASVSRATLPAVSSATETHKEPQPRRRAVGAVGYLQGMR